MDRIARETEPELPYGDWVFNRVDTDDTDVASSVARAAVGATYTLGLAAIVVPTRSGRTARLVSAHRPRTPVLAISPRLETVRRLNLLFGVQCEIAEEWTGTHGAARRLRAARPRVRRRRVRRPDRDHRRPARSRTWARTCSRSIGSPEVKVDAGTYQPTLDAAGAAAVEAEGDGYDGWWAFETQIDPFLACAVAAERTERIGIGTSIVVAFARNPMTVALQANDVQALSGGRFTLGLGSQIKPHITRRYSMPWSKPAARMREFILAIRAIWDTWGTGAPLEFEGDFYTHTLMAPFFDPGPNPHGNPTIMLAAVGPLMTETAGEVADGVLVPRLLDRALPARGDPAGARARLRQGRAHPRGLRDHRAGVRRRRRHRGGDRRRGRRRSSSRSPSTARRPPTARCSSCTAGASSRTSSRR